MLLTIIDPWYKLSYFEKEYYDTYRRWLEEEVEEIAVLFNYEKETQMEPEINLTPDGFLSLMQKESETSIDNLEISSLTNDLKVYWYLITRIIINF